MAKTETDYAWENGQKEMLSRLTNSIRNLVQVNDGDSVEVFMFFLGKSIGEIEGEYKEKWAKHNEKT